MPKSAAVPGVVTKHLRRKAKEAERIAIKKLVFARDGGKCRVCGGRAEEMHELDFRSLGGQRSLENSIAVCIFRGKNCHQLLQKHAIEVEGTDANTRLIFRWNRAMVARGSEPFRIRSKRRSQRGEIVMHARAEAVE